MLEEVGSIAVVVVLALEAPDVVCNVPTLSS